MNGKSQYGTLTPRRTSTQPGERGQRRPYQKPRVERHLASSLILGNVSGTPDGLSGGERLAQP